MPRRFRYSRWDGTQQVPDFEAEDLFAEVTDDLIHHGDPDAALRRLLREGFETRDGQRIEGLREMLDRLRERRKELLEANDPGGIYEDISRRLNEIVDTERAAIDEQENQDLASGDDRLGQLSKETAAEKRMELDLLPDDLAGKVRALQEHEWSSVTAELEFHELLEDLRRQLAEANFNQMAEALGDMGSEEREQLRQAMSDLNRLIEKRREGTDTQEDFDEFMAKHGQLFPGNPKTLDELLKQMAEQMAAMSRMMADMTPGQRDQLRQLSEQLLGEDMDLNFEMTRLGDNLADMFPRLDWGESMGFNPDGQGQPMNLDQANDVLRDLADLDALENMLNSTRNPGALADVDLEKARRLMGDDAARHLEALGRMARSLEDQGLVEQREGRTELTPRGLHRMGANALRDLFRNLDPQALGRHTTYQEGLGTERTYESKPYEYGDPFNLDIQKTVRNAVTRGLGTPVRLTPEDFEVERTERLTRTSTVLALDLSLSMPMGDFFVPAKKVAVALHHLITSRYPSDYVGLIGFSEVARQLNPRELPTATWDYVYGTNYQHALALARKMLANQPGTKQIIMITDGAPTAHIEPDGSPYFEYPTSPATAQATLAEVNRCTKAGITINTFMLEDDPYLGRFVEQMTQLNRGRAFFATPDKLGEYLLVDFLTNRRRRTA